MSSLESDFDIAIVGAGFSGSALALVLNTRRPDLNVTVLDKNPTYPEVFRAEKLESHQYDSMLQLGIHDHIRPIDPVFIDGVMVVVGKKEDYRPQSNHRGMDYTATVRQLREMLTESDILQVANVSEACNGGSGYHLRLSDGRMLRSKLLIISTGVDTRLINSLGIADRQEEPLRTTCFGFDVETVSEAGFPHQAFNFLPSPMHFGLDYVTFFPIGTRMRANVFTCWEPASRIAREFKKQPLESLVSIFPTLAETIGAMRLTSKVQYYSGCHYRRDCRDHGSLALIGDAYQSVSPATGMGISKCLADIFAILECVASNDFRSAATIDTTAYYDQPDKLSVDEAAFNAWRWSNESCTSKTISTSLRHWRNELRKTVVGAALAKLLAVARRHLKPSI